ncbi:hypothetical protein BDW66DRAFT_137766, partial [Aspergillus desertorum]
MKTPKTEHFCYHMDLKPSNILIFSEPGADGKIRNIWRISDFDMSCMKIRRSEGALGEERNVNRWFIRRSELDTKEPFGKAYSLVEVVTALSNRLPGGYYHCADH